MGWGEGVSWIPWTYLSEKSHPSPTTPSQRFLSCMQLNARKSSEYGFRCHDNTRASWLPCSSWYPKCDSPSPPPISCHPSNIHNSFHLSLPYIAHRIIHARTSHKFLLVRSSQQKETRMESVSTLSSRSILFLTWFFFFFQQRYLFPHGESSLADKTNPTLDNSREKKDKKETCVR